MCQTDIENQIRHLYLLTKLIKQKNKYKKYY